MKKPVFPVLLAFLSISLSLPANNSNVDLPGKNHSLPIKESESLAIYSSLELEKYNLSQKAFDWAWAGYKKLLQQNRIQKTRYLTICDLSQSSRRKRFYLIDLVDQKLILNTYVAHGRNSGNEYATRFSNRPESHQSSLGFYVTSQTYYGEHGLSLKLRGLESGINDKALDRKIVIHGADYAEPGRIKILGYLGRSYGCPALPEHQSKFVINRIRDGSCLFIYYPSENYQKRSKILND